MCISDMYHISQKIERIVTLWLFVGCDWKEHNSAGIIKLTERG